jgi:hypothetical protein
MKTQGDPRGRGTTKTLVVLLSVVALFFFGIILKRMILA